jgi:hypothetical protein
MHALLDRPLTHMRTVLPSVFIAFKQCMATHATHREEAKRRRDLRQASIVQSLMDNGLLLAEAGLR